VALLMGGSSWMHGYSQEYPIILREKNEYTFDQWRSQELYMEGAGQSNMYRSIVYYKISIYIKREGGSVLIIY
jgi:hypothetical protein